MPIMYAHTFDLLVYLLANLFFHKVGICLMPQRQACCYKLGRQHYLQQANSHPSRCSTGSGDAARKGGVAKHGEVM